jgi:hypothetical protein
MINPNDSSEDIERDDHIDNVYYTIYTRLSEIAKKCREELEDSCSSYDIDFNALLWQALEDQQEGLK